MKTVSVRYNKIVTVITENNGQSSVFNIKSKKSAMDFLSTLNSFEMHISSNIKRVVSNLEKLGFNVSIDESFGFEWECKLYVNR